MFEKSYNGKLLLTGEYFVLNGADSIVLPLRYGQRMSVLQKEDKDYGGFIHWRAFENGKIWLDAKILAKGLQVINTNHVDLAEKLVQIISAFRNYAPVLFSLPYRYEVKTDVGFNRKWGWGTSSTLISALADYAGVDAYKMNQILFMGSGYDIAASKINSPFLYNIYNKNLGHVGLHFTDSIFFVYLGKKKSSSDAVKKFKSKKVSLCDIEDVSQISKLMLKTTSVEDFERLINEHEDIVSKAISEEKVKDAYFYDFDGAVKSLGAWGGDFVMMLYQHGKEKLIQYLKNKRLHTVFSFSDIVRPTDNEYL